MRRFIAISIVAATAFAAGCSSDAPGAESSTPPSVNDTDVPETPPPTAAAETTTSAPPSTAAPTTTSTTTTTTTTSPPPTTAATTTTPPTTIDPLIDDIKTAVKQSGIDLEAAILAAGMDPANAALRAALLDYVTAERYVALEQFFDDLVADGLLVRANTEIPDSVTYVSDVELPNGSASTEAFVDACRVNSSIVYRPLEDGGEVLIDDTIATTLSRLRLILVDGQWVLESSVRLAAWDGANTCDV